MKWTVLNQENADPLRVMVAERLFERIRGLIGQKTLASNQALLLTPCNSIHTLGLRFPLDIIFLDKRNLILEIHPAVPPCRLRSCWHASKVLELQAGQAMARHWNPGVFLNFSNDM